MSSYLSSPSGSQGDKPRASESAPAITHSSRPLIYSGLVLLAISLGGFIYTLYPFATPRTARIDLGQLFSQPQTPASDSSSAAPASGLSSGTPDSSSDAASNSSAEFATDAGMTNLAFAGQSRKKPKPSTSVIVPGGIKPPPPETPGPQTPPPRCPELSLQCPKDVVEEGQPAIFSVKVSGDTPDATLIYKWSVSAGVIIKGQGSPAIAVETSGLAGKSLAARPMVGGLDRRCGNIFPREQGLCSVRIIKQQPPETVAGRIEGRVTFDGKGIPNIGVGATMEETGRRAVAVTDANGDYAIKGLADGRYNVSIREGGDYSFKDGARSYQVIITPQNRIHSDISFKGSTPVESANTAVNNSRVVNTNAAVKTDTNGNTGIAVNANPDSTVNAGIIPPAPPVRSAGGPEPGQAGTIQVSWPQDLAKSWRGTISVSYLPPPGGKRPRDLLEGSAAFAKFGCKGEELKGISSDLENERPLDSSPQEWSITVEPEDNAGSRARCLVSMTVRLQNRETGESRTIEKELAVASINLSTAPVSRNQALGFSTAFGVAGLGLIGFGSRSRSRRGRGVRVNIIGDVPSIETKMSGRAIRSVLDSNVRRVYLGEMSEPSISGSSGSENEYVLDNENLTDTTSVETSAKQSVEDEEESLAGAELEPDTPEYKQISAWITEREHEPQTPLRLSESYTLNFKVGQAVASSLLSGPAARVPETDIPAGGLNTEWIVVSRTVRLKPLMNRVSISGGLINHASVWTATFPLHIPKEGESEIVRLCVIPLSAERTGLDIYIHVAGELYRQLVVKFDVEGGEETRPQMTNGLGGFVWQRPIRTKRPPAS